MNLQDRGDLFDCFAIAEQLSSTVHQLDAFQIRAAGLINDYSQRTNVLKDLRIVRKIRNLHSLRGVGARANFCSRVRKAVWTTVR